MIRFLINFTIIFIIISCEEIKENKISYKVNESIKKIEKIVETKENNEDLLIKRKNYNDENIFYFLGEPYFIEGVKYTPEENYNYIEFGISTYYGKELHNVKTINNDFNKVTELLGRHKTLPIPSMVKVTNLENGLSINVKIIDRHQDNTSLIQVSRKVAQLLGFYKDKIATVKVEILSDASKQWKSVSKSLSEPEFDETISSAPTEVVSISNIDNTNLENNNMSKDQPVELMSEDVKDFNLYLKISKFNNLSNIKSTMDNLPNNIPYTSKKAGDYYNIILGPIDKIEINKLVS